MKAIFAIKLSFLLQLIDYWHKNNIILQNYHP